MIVNRFERYEQIRINHADITRKKKFMITFLNSICIALKKDETGQLRATHSNPGLAGT